jgi:hypothetical protein
VKLRGGFVGFGNTAPRGQLLVHWRRERLGPPATFNARTDWRGLVSPKEGDYARAKAMGVRVILMCCLALCHPCANFQGHPEGKGVARGRSQHRRRSTAPPGVEQVKLGWQRRSGASER